MLLWEKVNFAEEKKKVSEKIIRWSNRQKKFLNIISVPYNSTEMFVGVIEKYISKGKKIIYITDENIDKVNILSNIKRYTNLKEYTYIKNPKNNDNSNLKICSFKTAAVLEEKFNLIIYDDISSISYHGRHEILHVFDKLAYENSRIISYSIEEILRNGEYIVLPVKNNSIPMVEPRTVITRLNISRNIPFVIYDYLKWSISEGRKVIIYVPDEIKVREVASYIKQYCKYVLENILCFEKGKSNKNTILKFLNAGHAILITNCMENLVPRIENSDVMIYFADNKNFNYKELVYLCASVIRDKTDLKGEVIFLANCETEEMEKAKYIARNFNKEAWDMGLLKA